MQNRPTDRPLKPGEFPFPLNTGATESPLLTWLRNHSNYMAVRGLLDYLRAIAVLLRGIVINSVVTFPTLLLIALGVGWLYGPLLYDWDEQLAPSEERNKALEDYRRGYRRNADKTTKGPALRAALDDEQERMEQRRRTAQIHFFFTHLDTRKRPFRHDDFAALDDLAKTLNRPQRPFDRWVAARLSPYTVQVLNDYAHHPADFASPLRDALFEEFNLLLHDPFVSTAIQSPGSDITLRAGTRRLLKEWTGARTTAIGGFTDLPALARLLKGPPNRPIDRWIAGQLSPETRKAVVDYQGASSDPRALEKKLAEFLEGLIRGPAIDQESRFAEVTLRPKTERLRRENPTGDNLVRLNRLLIEDAYPRELWWHIAGVDLASLNHLLLEDAYPKELNRHRGGWVMWMQDHLDLRPPFVLTPVVLGLAGLWVLLFPIMTVIARIRGHQQSLHTGTGSSVKSRDHYERTFGAVLLVLTATALFELLPLIVHFYHQFRVTQLDGALPWKQYLGAASVAYSVLAGARKLTAALGGLWRQLAVIGIGLLGLLAPFMVIVAAADFLVYSEFPATWANIERLLAPLVAIPGIYLIAIAAFLGFGYFKRTYSKKDAVRFSSMAFWMLFGHLVLIAVMAFTFVVLDGVADYLPKILVCSDPTVTMQAVGQLRGDLSAYFVLVAALEILLFCWLTVDINQTSVHGLYRDRLASAYLLRFNARGKVDIEDDVPLADLCRHDAGSIAPYHLINVALNLQGSKDLNLRDRKSDFFIFSKKFIGGARTGYCRSVTMEQVFPQIDLASAMAISAAAAAPNMGRGTSPWLVPFLTLINLRLGVWVPHPGLLAEEVKERPDRWRLAARQRRGPVGYAFDEVFRAELVSIQKRWLRLSPAGGSRQLAPGQDRPTVAHGLFGIGFSGGGIRSATLNLGIAQVLHRHGVFDHLDYMSTVSGGGYLGSSISAFMRFQVSPISEIAGTVDLMRQDQETVVTVKPERGGSSRSYRFPPEAVLDVKQGDVIGPGRRLIRRAGPPHRSEIAGTVTVEQTGDGHSLVRVTDEKTKDTREYRFEKYEQIRVRTGQSIDADEYLVNDLSSFGQRFRWRVPFTALLREMMMRLDERHRWVNLSDGGHLENLATIELLRRRCKLIVIGDGEADPNHHFEGLAILLRTASIDLGIKIEINLDALRLDASRRTRGHFAIGRILYPGNAGTGYLLYLKSSFSGDEGEIIGEYRNRKPAFPHEPTADQFFDEGQFEAYRALGEHIGETAVDALTNGQCEARAGLADFPTLDRCFHELWERQPSRPPGNAPA